MARDKVLFDVIEVLRPTIDVARDYDVAARGLAGRWIPRLVDVLRDGDLAHAFLDEVVGRGGEWGGDLPRDVEELTAWQDSLRGVTCPSVVNRALVALSMVC